MNRSVPAGRPLYAGALQVGAVAIAGITLPWLALPWIQTAFLGGCEGFGCAGGLAFALPVSLIGGAIAAIAAMSAYWWAARRSGAHPNHAWLRTLAASLVLAPVLRSVPRWPIPDYGLPVAWFIACLIVYAILLRFPRRSR